MTWAEFLIRQHAYHRIEKNEWYKIREIAYAALIGSHSDPNKLPKSKEKFMPLDGDGSGVKTISETSREAMRKALIEYNNKLNG
jgi:hypothetical protein